MIKTERKIIDGIPSDEYFKKIEEAQSNELEKAVWSCLTNPEKDEDPLYWNITQIRNYVEDKTGYFVRDNLQFKEAIVYKFKYPKKYEGKKGMLYKIALI